MILGLLVVREKTYSDQMYVINIVSISLVCGDNSVWANERIGVVLLGNHRAQRNRQNALCICCNWGPNIISISMMFN